MNSRQIQDQNITQGRSFIGTSDMSTEIPIGTNGFPVNLPLHTHARGNEASHFTHKISKMCLFLIQNEHKSQGDWNQWTLTKFQERTVTQLSLFHANYEWIKVPSVPAAVTITESNLRCKVFLTTGTSVVTKAKYYTTCQWRNSKRRGVKRVRVKVESPQRTLRKKWECKGGRVWLLDTNHLWSGAFTFRRKVVPRCFQPCLLMP